MGYDLIVTNTRKTTKSIVIVRHALTPFKKAIYQAYSTTLQRRVTQTRGTVKSGVALCGTPIQFMYYIRY